jgi:hypothetical protein
MISFTSTVYRCHMIICRRLSISFTVTEWTLTFASCPHIVLLLQNLQADLCKHYSSSYFNEEVCMQTQDELCSEIETHQTANTPTWTCSSSNVPGTTTARFDEKIDNALQKAASSSTGDKELSANNSNSAGRTRVRQEGRSVMWR